MRWLSAVLVVPSGCEAGRKVRPAQELDSQKKNQIDGAIECERSLTRASESTIGRKSDSPDQASGKPCPGRE